MNVAMAEQYVNTINTVLAREGVTKEPLLWPRWAGPDWMGTDAYAFELDMGSFKGKLNRLYHPDTLHALSTEFKGKQVKYVNTIGFAYLILGTQVNNPVTLPADLDNQCVMVVGPRLRGKTTLLQHFVARGLEQGKKVVVLDPKVQVIEGKWAGAEVVGAAGDYEAIERRLEDLVATMKAGGDGNKYLVVADETWNINVEVPGAMKKIWQLITLGAETGFTILLGTHSERVAGLGVSGQGDLRSAFAVVRLKEGYKAEIDFNNGEVRPGVLPGPFKGQVVEVVQPTLSRIEKILARIAIEKNGGSLALVKLNTLVKEHLPEHYWKPGGAPLTEWNVRQIVEAWQLRGLTTPPGGGVPPKPRMVTEELKRLAKNR